MDIEELIENRQFKIVVLCDLFLPNGQSIVAPCKVKDEYVCHPAVLCISYHGEYYNTTVLYTYIDEPRATWSAVVVHEKFPRIGQGDPVPVLAGFDMKLIKD